jgi:YggT family protein
MVLDPPRRGGAAALRALTRCCHCPSGLARLEVGPAYRRGETMLLAVFQILDMLLWILTIIIIAQAIISWLVAFNVINTHNDFVRSLLYALDRMTDPLYRPIRKILPDFGGIDFSPLVVLLIIFALRTLLGGVAADIALSSY